MKANKSVSKVQFLILTLTATSLVILFNNCSRGYINHGSALNIPSNAEVNTPSNAEVNTPSNSVPLPAIALPKSPELIGDMGPYIPQIAADKCEPKIAVVDPFVGFKGNVKTVCSANCNYSTIKEAFDQAQANDEIVIKAGTYPADCPTLSASPVIVRGEGGMVNIDGKCPIGIAGMRVLSPVAKIHNIKITNAPYGAFFIGNNLKYVELSDFWVENAKMAVSGNSSSTGTLVLKRFKIKNVGKVYGSNDHTTAVLTTQPEKLIVTLGTFSDFALNSGVLLAYDVPNIEFLCNAVIRSPADAGLNFSVTRGHYIRIANNYMLASTLSTYFYQYLSPATGTDLLYENNYFLTDRDRMDFVAVTTESMRIQATGNTYVGNGLDSLNARAIDLKVNTFFKTRIEAGLLPAPSIPASWPIDASKL